MFRPPSIITDVYKSMDFRHLSSFTYEEKFHVIFGGTIPATNLSQCSPQSATVEQLNDRKEWMKRRKEQYFTDFTDVPWNWLTGQQHQKQHLSERNSCTYLLSLE